MNFKSFLLISNRFHKKNELLQPPSHVSANVIRYRNKNSPIKYRYHAACTYFTIVIRFTNFLCCITKHCSNKNTNFVQLLRLSNFLFIRWVIDGSLCYILLYETTVVYLALIVIIIIDSP